VKVGNIDLLKLSEDRDQLWAEAAAHEANGGSLGLPQDLWEAARSAQEERQLHDPWLDWLANIPADQHGREERISSARVLSYLEIPTDRATAATYQRIRDCMVRLGWSKRKLKINGHSAQGFVRPARNAEQQGHPF
jgi:predicted P-loop ATPase